MTITINFPTWLLWVVGLIGLPLLFVVLAFGLFCGYLAWLLWWPGNASVADIARAVTDPSYGDSTRDSAS